MKSFREELEKEFPRTPESFRQCVNNAVAEHTSGKIRNFHLSKVVIPVAACLTLICGTVAAAELPRVQQWLSELGINGPRAEKQLINVNDNPDAIQIPTPVYQDNTEESSDENPLFTVTDAYYDGATLMFWAKPGAELATLEFGDHVYINGTDNRLEYVVETEEGSGIYQCEVTVMDSSLSVTTPESLEVRVKVYMADNSKQDFTFTIKSDKLSGAGTAANQLMELSYGKVEICDLIVAPSKVSFRLKWTVYSDEALEIVYMPEYFYEDSNGIRYSPRDLRLNSSCSLKVLNEETDWWEYEQGFEFQDFDSSSDYITLIPFEGGYNEEGTFVEGTEILREDMSFTIKLK